MIDKTRLSQAGAVVINLNYRQEVDKCWKSRCILYDLNSGTDVLEAIAKHTENSFLYDTVTAVRTRTVINCQQDFYGAVIQLAYEFNYRPVLDFDLTCVNAE